MLFGMMMFSTLYFLLSEHLHYLLILVFSHVLSVFNNWVMYRRFVFASRSNWLAEYLRFNISSLIVLAFNIVGLWALVTKLDLHPILSQILVLVATVALSYLIHAGYSFRHRGGESRYDQEH
jgi:putative flippase GtrA